MSFSVIIPTLNEEGEIGATIGSVQEAAQQADVTVEILVADGGSADATRAVATASGAICMSAPRGRGLQCHAGARAAQGDVLLFLHADTRLPLQAFAVLGRYLGDSRVQAGTFRLGFQERHWLFTVYRAFSRFDSIFTTFGDQCIVIRRSLYEEIGGFPHLPLFEDVALLQQIRSQTRIYSFPAAVTTSARRFRQAGVIRQSLRNGWYVLQYLCGEPAEKLAVKYEQSRRR